ncbi:MAG: CooT family nickel-binding protein [Moorellales bacterium]
MCEANAYLLRGDKEELLLESVDRVIPQEDGILLEDIFGKRKLIKARIKEMALVDHRIILEPTGE